MSLVQDMAQDFDTYYLKNRYSTPEPTNDLLVLTFDGKGIVMRPNSLREYTKKKAKQTQKLNSRLSAGEKKTVNVWRKLPRYIPCYLIIAALSPL